MKRYIIEINGWNRENEVHTFDFAPVAASEDEAVEIAAAEARAEGVEIGECVVVRVEAV
jgi:hypothetical protein